MARKRLTSAQLTALDREVVVGAVWTVEEFHTLNPVQVVRECADGLFVWVVPKYGVEGRKHPFKVGRSFFDLSGSQYIGTDKVCDHEQITDLIG